MRKVNIGELVPGMVVSREVMSREGITLLEKGMVLTRSQIVNLHYWGVRFIYIEEEPGRGADAPAGAGRPTAAFLNQYIETVDAVRQAFEHVRYFKEVPVMAMNELAEQRIILLTETVGVLDYLYDIRLHSDYTFQHSLNVAIIAGIIGKWRNYKGVELKDIIMAALLHDIGKLSVPLAILDKPAKLSPGEFEIVKQHSREGYRLVKDSGQLAPCIKLGILQHHERLDGTGYPAGLTGDKIHAYARIIAIADIYDAMTSDRTYRRRLTPLAALDSIAGQMYGQLETSVCLTFLENAKNHFTGNHVLLSNGERAKIIILNNRNRNWTKPVVCIANGTLLDLEEENISIVELLQEG